ncbi:Synaptosomal-associated protein 25 [Trachymyrmex zeteki]|uniref:Synaptosomal-associated protein n=1 Tax=Mycetomoellerius zeteki TaxID=64791 RepID=A0A151WQW9_9HYME|nr:Synaptosomal-associated protein 25 [Trachymyrmex zeteki]
MDQINADMREAEKNLTGMEKCCGLCVLPCNKGASFKEDEGTWKGNDDGKVVNNQPQRVMDDRNGIGPQSGYIAKITNDAREGEMEENMGQVNTMIGNLRNMAIDMGSELENQNRQIDRINRKGVPRLPRAIKASHWDVSSLPVHTLQCSSGSIGLTRLTRGGRAACEFHPSRWFAWISPICQGRRIERDEDTGGQRASPSATQKRKDKVEKEEEEEEDSHGGITEATKKTRSAILLPLALLSNPAHPAPSPNSSLLRQSRRDHKKHDAARESISVGDSGTTIVILE